MIPPRPIRQGTEDTVVPRPAPSPRFPLAASPRAAREDTPLLRKTTSLTFAEPRRPSAGDVIPGSALPGAEDLPPTLARRASQASTRDRRGSTGSRATKGVQAGQSTFGQTVSTRSASE